MPVSVPPARPGPAWGWLALALFACLLFVQLGFWQWHRAQVREAAWRNFARGADQVVSLGSSATDALPLYQRVRVQGMLDSAHQFLIDNRSFQGRPGYEVLTPLVRQGAATLLIDRGWVPLTASRRELPDVTVVAGQPVTLTGRLGGLPVAGLAMGHAAPDPAAAWPKVASFPSMAELVASAGTDFEPRVLLLDAQAPFGYARDWQPGLAPLRHYSYAIQWWSFAALTMILWGVLTFRRRRAVATTS